MKPSPITITVSVAGIILAFLGLVYGSLLPFMKAQSYIAAESRLSQVRSVDDFKEIYDVSFNFYSPVGDEEIAKFLGSNILNGVSQRQPEDAARQLVEYIDGRLFKDDVRHLLMSAQMYQVLWEKYGGKEEDYRKALEYFEKAHQIGPNLPPPLYKLLGLYAEKGDKANFERVAKLILERWPQDEATKKALEEAS